MSKDALTIVSEIDDLLRGVWTHLEDPQNLSLDILKLAVLNGGLGNWLAEAQDTERHEEANYKNMVDKVKLSLVATGDSATVAESKAKQLNYSSLQLWLQAQHTVTVLKLKRQDTDQAIDAARSRLSLIKQDMKQS